MAFGTAQSAHTCLPPVPTRLTKGLNENTVFTYSIPSESRQMSNAVVIGQVASSTLVLPGYSCRVPAGLPSPALAHTDRPLPLEERLEGDAAHTYLGQASGDSRGGVGICDGAVRGVDRKVG